MKSLSVPTDIRTRGVDHYAETLHSILDQ